MKEADTDNMYLEIHAHVHQMMFTNALSYSYPVLQCCYYCQLLS